MKNTSSGKSAIIVLASLTLLFTAVCSMAQKPKKAPSKVPKANAETAGPAKAPEQMVFKFVEQMPEFQGNMPEWLAGHLHYPDSARVNNIEGRSIVEFVIAEDGSITKPKVIRTSGNSYLDAEALRAVGAMPVWKPGKQQGKAVSVFHTLPITFKLED